MRHLCTAIMLLGLAGAGQVLAASSCGDRVSGFYRLDRDLICPGMPAALEVVSDSSAIDLGGFSLAAPDGDAINLGGHDNIEVHNGRIRWSHDGIDASKSDYVSVRHVTFQANRETSVRLTDARWSKIESNEFIGFSELGAVLINADPTSTLPDPGHHRIYDNRFRDVFHGVYICGEGVTDNLILSNDFMLAYEVSLVITGESTGNEVHGNKFRRDTWNAILIGNAHYNTIKGNAFETAGVGISVDAAPANPSLCRVSDNAPKAYGNKLDSNHFYGSWTGISLGGVGRVGEHDMHGNRFNGGEYGFRAGPGADDNDGRGNSFFGTRIPVEDRGSGNRW